MTKKTEPSSEVKNAKRISALEAELARVSRLLTQKESSQEANDGVIAELKESVEELKKSLAEAKNIQHGDKEIIPPAGDPPPAKNKKKEEPKGVRGFWRRKT